MIKNNIENDNYTTAQDEIDWNLHNSGSFFLTGEIDDISTGEVVKWMRWVCRC